MCGNAKAAPELKILVEMNDRRIKSKAFQSDSSENKDVFTAAHSQEKNGTTDE